MHKSFRRLGAVVAVTAASLFAAPALAGYTSLTVFGDSLSDTGNLFIASAGTNPAPPYDQGRFSNGKVWVETLAAGLGRTADVVPALAGGQNYAFGGALTGVDLTPPGVLAQVMGLWAAVNAAADPTGLYVVIGGGNDMREARNGLSTDASRQSAAEVATQNLANSVSVLAARGATKVLISTLPDLGFTPEAAALGRLAESSDASMRFNALLLALEPTLEAMFPWLDVLVLDMNALATEVRNDALLQGGARFRITNVTAPCGSFPGSLGASCDVSLFSDDLHPSAAAHSILGRAALALVHAVPTPATLALGMVALALLGVQRGVQRRRQASARPVMG